MRYGLALAVAAATLAPSRVASAQPSETAPTSRRATARRVPSNSIRVDGRLDDEAWLGIAATTDFTQKEPTEGAAPTDATDIRFAYDDDALYVAARMQTERSPEVQAPLGQRDTADQAEHILIALDTFLDRRTAVVFGVTASGVRIDRFHPNDNEDNFTAGYDPVWQARTARDGASWTAELWIPFTQLRFNPQDAQVWGLNIRRVRPTLNEEDYWVLIPRIERTWVSRFGELHGIAGIHPSRRIELLPYTAGGSTVNSDRHPANPFDDGRNLTGRAGVDVKMGLGPNLTLEATVNPDFGQVEADAAEVNLTAFETRFPEKRPFFLEGSQLFTLDHPNLYYSRRIGARPVGLASGEFVDYPGQTTILAAGKLTGRLPSGTSVAFLSAATGEESARTATSTSPLASNVRVAPRAYWGVGRVQQEFGRNRSTAGLFINTVHRDVQAGEPLADLLTRNALFVGGDTTLKFKAGEYELRWAGGGSYVGGDAKAIERFQRASSHYAQRPDREYARLDPTRTSLSGFSFQTRFERVNGRHWLWNVGTKLDTPFFETNDIANFTAADGVMPTATVRFRETQPGRIFRSYSLALNQSWEWNFGGDRQTAQLRPSVNVTWQNFWTSSLQLTRTLHTKDSTLTRGGPLMQRPRTWSATASLGNRTTAETRVNGSATVGGDEDGGDTKRLDVRFSFRPGPRWQFSVNPFYEIRVDPQQYVATIIGGGRPETFGNRYVFSFIDRSTLSSEYRLGLTVRPDMNLDIYAEPFAASGRYYDFGELTAARERSRLTYGTAPGTSLTTLADGTRAVIDGASAFMLRARDFKALSFRTNVVLRWEWRPGSTLYVVWQQDRSDTETLGARVGVNDMFRSASAPGANLFLIKTSWWIPVR